ncbi:hypothetical protein ACQKMD_07970 [Viridibacillus sp. NPDC096237]|uniref:hypothetical protein n=1 Tax=Viridibacillus sp. NPDC096237 TaxID=3390721 RepID=UPI003CFCABE3
MNLTKKVLTFGFAATVLLTSVSTSATTYISSSLTGTNAETGYKSLGSGTRYLKGTGSSGSGNAYAMKIVKFFPDKAMTSISLSSGNSASSSFTAVSSTDDGITQSYYIRWNGSSSKAAADVKLTD